MASNSSKAVELLDHALSRAVDADPRTYYESDQGSFRQVRNRALAEGL